MKLVTKYIGMKRNLPMARTTYTAMLELTVDDRECEDNLIEEQFDKWIVDYFPYLVHAINNYHYGSDDCNCGF